MSVPGLRPTLRSCCEATEGPGTPPTPPTPCTLPFIPPWFCGHPTPGATRPDALVGRGITGRLLKAAASRSFSRIWDCCLSSAFSQTISNGCRSC